MPSDERTFYAAIVADATVSARLGTDANSQVKFYASPAPEGTALPLATWFTVNETPENKLAGGSSSSRFTIQVDVFSRDKAQAKSIAAAVKAAAEALANTHFDGSRDLYEQDVKAHRISMDFAHYGV